MKRFFIFIGVSILLVYLLFFVLSKPPVNFPESEIVSVKQGDSLRKISKELAEKKIIRNPAIFEAIIIFNNKEKKIVRGDYAFDTPLSVSRVAMRFIKGDFGGTQIKITLPEGLTRFQMADILKSRLPEFDSYNFILQSQADEGYLFPDTYFFFATNNEIDVLNALKENFKKKISPFEPQIKNSGRSLHQIITMASLIEKEALGDSDREDIAKILWKRIKENKLLQVDAPFLFLLNKQSSELTRTDLSIDSPYNTYKYKGLPPGPIGNPGILSIRAALNNGNTEYLFYLHGNDGIIHFAKTFDEHRKNIKLYLK